MKIDIADLLSRENLTEERQVQTELASFQSRLGDFRIIGKAPFLMHLENQENKRLLICGETDVTLTVPCDRCLKEVPVGLHLVIDRQYSLQEPDAEESADEEDRDYITGFELDIDKLIYHEILLNFPMKVLCREDCKGICRTCGTNLNDKTCSHDQTEPDPRMAAIWDVFNQFKEV